MTELSIPVEGLLLICILTETFVQVAKTAFPKEKQLSDTGINIISIVVAILLCFVLDVSIFTGNNAQVYLGSLFAGLIASRGANFTHDTLDAIASISSKK